MAVDCRDSLDDSTALMKAAESGALGAVKLLLEKGATPGLRDASGNTALDNAKKIYGVLSSQKPDWPLTGRLKEIIELLAKEH